MLCPSWVPVNAVKINPISSSSGFFFNMPHTYVVGTSVSKVISEDPLTQACSGGDSNINIPTNGMKGMKSY